MGIFTKLIDSVFEASWNRAQNKKLGASLAIRNTDSEPRNSIRTFTIHEALNGHYIEFVRYKYNPSGPNHHEQKFYLVRDGEPLVDAIATVLVLCNHSGDDPS